MDKAKKKRANPRFDYKKDLEKDDKAPIRSSKKQKIVKPKSEKALLYSATNHPLVDQLIVRLEGTDDTFKEKWQLAPTTKKNSLKSALTSIMYEKNDKKTTKTTAVPPPNPTILAKTRSFHVILDNVIVD